MGQFHDLHFPGESVAYRQARDELLAAESDLRRQIEEVAARRRALPTGGALAEDYAFTEADGSGSKARFSELFEAGKDTLALYSFMFAPEDAAPCPMCTAFLDGLNGNAPHISQQINLAVVAKSPASRLQEWADARGWSNLRLLSWEGTSFGADYLAETPDGGQQPILNIFQKTGDGIAHTYGTELFYAPMESFQNPRHNDAMWPLWALLDLTPGGRGEWYPSVDYE